MLHIILTDWPSDREWQRQQLCWPLKQRNFHWKQIRPKIALWLRLPPPHLWAKSLKVWSCIHIYGHRLTMTMSDIKCWNIWPDLHLYSMSSIAIKLLYWTLSTVYPLTSLFIVWGIVCSHRSLVSYLAYVAFSFILILIWWLE